MKLTPSILVALLALVLSFVPRFNGPGQVKNPNQQAADEDPLLSFAKAYLDKLCAQDFDALATLLDKNALFEDPTRVTLTGKVQRIEGREAMLKNFRSKASQQASSDVEILETFVTGEHVVIRLNYRTKASANVIRLEEGNERVSLAIPAVTILRIQNERIVHHQDYVDYASILRQVADELK